MKRYNPYTASFRAIATELTSDRAKQYYAIRAQQDTQMVIDATLTAGIAVCEAAVLAYQMGAFVRAWMHATEQSAVVPEYTPVDCTVDPEPQIGDDEFWIAVDAAIAVLETTEIAIDAETIDTVNFIFDSVRPIGLLPFGAALAPIPAMAVAADLNKQFVLNAIAPCLMPKPALEPDSTAKSNAHVIWFTDGSDAGAYVKMVRSVGLRGKIHWDVKPVHSAEQATQYKSLRSAKYAIANNESLKYITAVAQPFQSAGIAPRKSPTRATVGKYSASID